jgi:hypothetical protein
MTVVTKIKKPKVVRTIELSSAPVFRKKKVADAIAKLTHSNIRYLLRYSRGDMRPENENHVCQNVFTTRRADKSSVISFLRLISRFEKYKDLNKSRREPSESNITRKNIGAQHP